MDAVAFGFRAEVGAEDVMEQGRGFWRLGSKHRAEADEDGATEIP